MYPLKHGDASFQFTDARGGANAGVLAARTKLRANICSGVVLGGDLIAFVVGIFLAFGVAASPELSPYSRAVANFSEMGASWHGWGSLLVVVCLLGYFGGRGHYTSRVPVWTQMGDVVVATAVALACDIFLTVTIYGRPLQPEGLLRWVLVCPCLLLLRTATRHVLTAADVWSLRTLIVASPAEIEAAQAALTSDPALGYSVVGTIAPEAAASLGDDEILELVAARGAEFVVMVVRGGEAAAGRTVLDALRRSGVPIALVPILQGLPVVGFRQHYFVGHDIVMLVNRNNLARPFARVLKTASDQAGALGTARPAGAADGHASDAGARRRRPGLLPAPPHRRRRPHVRVHQVPLDVHRRRCRAAAAAGQQPAGGRGMGGDAEAFQRSAHYARGPFSAPLQPG